MKGPKKRFEELHKLMHDSANWPEGFEKSRRHPYIWYRNLICLQMRLEGYSLHQIGNAYGMNHSTIAHNLRATHDVLNYPRDNEKWLRNFWSSYHSLAESMVEDDIARPSISVGHLRRLLMGTPDNAVISIRHSLEPSIHYDEDENVLIISTI